MDTDMRGPFSLSFPKTRRLMRDSDFQRVKREGQTERGKLMVLGAFAVKDSGGRRAGFVVSRRLGNAVVRNRVRRRLREIVRTHQHDLRDDVWIVLIARRAAANAGYRTLEDEWLRLAKRASILL
jgi:ribonuclease P protein component